jgi:hypothetical protein
MKKRILSIALILALIAALAAPLAVYAANTTEIDGILGSTATLNAPTVATFTTFAVGDNSGSATAGSVVTSGTNSWTLTVADAKSNNNGKMTVGGTDDAGAIKLTDPLLVGITSGSVGTISSYESALQAAGGYGANGTFSIPLFFKQTIVTGDPAGSYKITLTYTLTPS